MIEAIFFDIDGTLVSNVEKVYPPSIPSVLEKLHKKGIRLFIATGRPKQTIIDEHLLDGLFFDAYATLNGQYCFNGKDTIHMNPIPREAVRQLYDMVTALQIPCTFVEKDLVYLNIHNDKVRKGFGSIHTKPYPLYDAERCLKNEIFQLSPFIGEGEDFELPEAVKKHCKKTRWCKQGIDILPATGGKASGIDHMLKYYNIPLENTMAFGDGDNDIEMLTHVSVGVALGNAEPEVKECADYVTDTVDNDGVLHALEHFGVL